MRDDGEPNLESQPGFCDRSVSLVWLNDLSRGRQRDRDAAAGRALWFVTDVHGRCLGHCLSNKAGQMRRLSLFLVVWCFN